MTKMVSAREFNQQTSRISKAAAAAPVVITDRGRPSLILMSYEEYRRLTGIGRPRSLAEAFASLPQVPDSPEIVSLFDRRRTLHQPFEFDED